ncbi:MAG: glutamine-hydrolyzing GMP synthase [Gammaproteobacteria bacterium]|jgi:GMP synthase (glutamine-hydrolysing)|nr:glutamine-hydrolyzing GMP synthase [Gammaproteobacteria bacterium]
MSTVSQHKILILDFGSQYSQLIARRVRDAGVYCEMHAFDWSVENIKAFAPTGIILSGGPESVHLEDTPRIAQIIFDLQCPLLGICYGMQAMAHQLGGKVAPSGKREYGHAQITVTHSNALFDDMKALDVWMSHGDKVVEIPAGFKIVASSQNAPIAAMADEQRHYYGLQFHPEVTHTHHGQTLIERFLFDICHVKADWTPINIIEQSVKEIKEQVGNDQVLLGLSGGVDSAVAAALIHRAIGNQLTCVFVDNGLLRLNEAEQVMATFAEHMGVKVVHVNAAQVFYEALQGVTDPEEKRKAIGKTFIEIFEKEAAKFEQIKFLAQGTIYPDVIESAGAHTGKAHVIKSHHNVGGLPLRMKLKLCEPLRLLFKDEVRKVGIALGLPEKLVMRHPFPGPGLGVRILGEVKPEYADILRKADAIFIDSLHEFNYYQKVSQAFVVFLPVKAVGVMGDARSYEYVVALRAVETTDFMTATWAQLPYELLAHVSNRIINEIPGIARVTYDISSKPPATIEWE